MSGSISARSGLRCPRSTSATNVVVCGDSGQWLPVNDLVPPKPGEQVEDLIVRVRTIGDIISTGCVVSPADNVDDIIAEIAVARVTERGSRADDKASEAAMEDRKKAGYF